VIPPHTLIPGADVEELTGGHDYPDFLEFYEEMPGSRPSMF